MTASGGPNRPLAQLCLRVELILRRGNEMTAGRHGRLIVLLRLLALHLALRRSIVTLRQLLLITLLRRVGGRVGKLLILWLLLNDHHLPVRRRGSRTRWDELCSALYPSL